MLPNGLHLNGSKERDPPTPYPTGLRLSCDYDNCDTWIAGCSPHLFHHRALV